MKIIIYRILGNDLPPRHKIGQTYENTRFILTHEPKFPGVSKKWIVNRIVDPVCERKIVSLLEMHDQSFIRIPFNLEEYKTCSVNPHLDHLLTGEQVPVDDLVRIKKLHYITNVNCARNVALEDGKREADWILPLDGNCFITSEGWQCILKKLEVVSGFDQFFMVPMYRIFSNEQVFEFKIENQHENEPQIIFGKHTSLQFDSHYRYGNEDKVELIRRIGFALEYTGNSFRAVDSRDKCGFVIRLFSGVPEAEHDIIERANLRNQGIDALLSALDHKSINSIQVETGEKLVASLIDPPLVFIVVLNWNSAELITECIKSLLQLAYSSYEIVVVDDCSTDGSDEEVRTRFPDIKHLRTSENIGFAGANNLGISYSLVNGAEYIWLLNNDTVVDKYALIHLVNLSLSDSAIGMVGSKIFYYDEPGVLWCAGGKFDAEKGGITSLIGWGQKDIGQFDDVLDVDFVNACSLLVKKTVIEKIGPMPEEYFLYFEETEWNYTAHQVGIRTVVAQNSMIWHKVKRKDEYLVRFVYYMTRNRFLLINKIYPNAIIPCIKYQFTEGRKLLSGFYKNKEYIKLSRFTYVLVLAWLHGLVLNKKGKNTNIY